MTADGRWFDNGGMPIETPTKLEPEKVKSQEELDEDARLKAERETAMLSNLKWRNMNTSTLSLTNHGKT